MNMALLTPRPALGEVMVSVGLTVSNAKPGVSCFQETTKSVNEGNRSNLNPLVTAVKHHPSWQYAGSAVHGSAWRAASPPPKRYVQAWNGCVEQSAGKGLRMWLTPPLRATRGIGCVRSTKSGDWNTNCLVLSGKTAVITGAAS